MKMTFDCTSFYQEKTGHLHIAEIQSDIGLTSRYLTKKGKPWVPVMGEFHFSRYAVSRWEDEILKMKACGISIISTYLFWIFHEREEGVFDFSGERDIRSFLRLCRKHKMLVLLRIGPWCHGEVKYGGFPAFIHERKDKRSNAPGYLCRVKRLYEAYYEQCEGELYPAGPVLGIQLENEYEGRDKDHLQVLRKLVLECGFRLPLYTCTAWPVITKAANNILPLFGGYPERPWVQDALPLRTDDRFRIVDSRMDDGIGCDILKPSGNGDLTYFDFPYACCELGCGVQVTEHRRPVISPEDTYAMLLVCLAKGMNLPGYYMFHGGRNPGGNNSGGKNVLDETYQESRKSGYPNNCPVISYDFQAPVSEFGFLRESALRHKLVHYFLQCFGEEFALMQSFFPVKTGDEADGKAAVRMAEDGRGFVFLNTYQRLEPLEPMTDLRIELEGEGKVFCLPPMDVERGTSFFYPFRQTYGSIAFLYITAQPLCRTWEDGRQQIYFFRPCDRECRFLTAKTVSTQAIWKENTWVLENYREERPAVWDGNTDIFILSQERAKMLWYLDGKVSFSRNVPLFQEDMKEELVLRPAEGNLFCLKEIPFTKDRFDCFLYSRGRKIQYELLIPEKLWETQEDYLIVFRITGNAAQVWCRDTLAADCFNYNGTMELSMDRLREVFRSEEMSGRGEPEHRERKVRIKVSPVDRSRSVYFEIPVSRGKAELAVKEVFVLEKIKGGE